MENKNSLKSDQEQRSILYRIFDPRPEDEVVVRIFFWISIFSCVFLPRIFEVLADNKEWNVIAVAWFVLAVYVRIKAFTRR